MVIPFCARVLLMGSVAMGASNYIAMRLFVRYTFGSLART